MKNLAFIISLIIFNSFQAKTSKDSLSLKLPLSTNLFDDCDACGCAAGNGSSGFESLLNPQFVGVKYFAQHYKAKENLFINDLTQDQYFNTIQLWAKIPVLKKLSVYASVPYHFHEKKTLQGDININGIGDFNLMGIYKLINSKDTTHELNGGVGVKVPLGKFNEKGISGVNPSFQLGTGSWDYQSVLHYRFQKSKIALLLTTDYTMKTENKKKYQFGNQWNYSATGFYQVWGDEKSIISAKAGFQGEVYGQNRQYKEPVPKTAGSALYGKIGFEASFKKMSFGTELMLPTYTHLASGTIEAKSRVSIFLNFGI